MSKGFQGLSDDFQGVGFRVRNGLVSHLIGDDGECVQCPFFKVGIVILRHEKLQKVAMGGHDAVCISSVKPTIFL